MGSGAQASEKHVAWPGARQAARCLSALRGCINLLLSTWGARLAPEQSYIPTFANTGHTDRDIFHIYLHVRRFNPAHNRAHGTPVMPCSRGPARRSRCRNTTHRDNVALTFCANINPGHKNTLIPGTNCNLSPVH